MSILLVLLPEDFSIWMVIEPRIFRLMRPLSTDVSYMAGFKSVNLHWTWPVNEHYR